MINMEWWQLTIFIIDYSIKLLAIGIVPEGRRPSSATGWLLAILLLPVLGLPLFLLMGSPYINKRRHRVQREANEMIKDVHESYPDLPANTRISNELMSIVNLNRTLTSMPAVVSESHQLHSDYSASLRRMAELIDAAESYVHVEIYIVSWDDATDHVFKAMGRAVQRGVKVRLLFDQVGSWKYPNYRSLGRRLTNIGVEWHLMLPLQPWRWRFRRPDLRNHRKLVVVDGQVALMGSQNLIDASYLSPANIKEGRHWVDVMVELTGPVVTSLDMVFAMDWYMETEEVLIPAPNEPGPGGPDAEENVLQLIPSGPGYNTEPNLRLFNSVVHHAKDRLILCSPYFIPDESLLEAVTTACYRGVRVDLLVNEKSDQFMVGHAQSSFYQALLEAGVRIFLYPEPAVLHSKFMIADPHGDAASVVGSSNMDMRSFGLNYETSLLVVKGALTAELFELAEDYIATSRELTLEEWNQRSFGRRYVDNALRLTSALQ